MYKDIFNWLEKNKHLDTSQISEIKRYAFQRKCGDIQAVLDNGACTKDEIVIAVKEIYNLDTYREGLNGLKPIKEIPISEMMDNRYFVASLDNENVLVLISDPRTKLSMLNKINQLNIRGNRIIKFIFADEIEEWNRSNRREVTDQKLNLVVSGLGVAKQSSDTYSVDAEELDSESIVGIVNNIIYEAVKEGASDIHIEPCSDQIRIRFRVDGLLKTHTRIDNKAVHQQIVNRVKILANMNTNNFQTPQSGKINMSILDKEVDMRVSTLPSIYGEKVTIRILVSQNVKIRTLEELGFTLEMCERVRYLAEHPHGIIIISGPTGSGKTSTLASLLTEVNDTEQNIVTIEDPVEYKIDGATQVNVNDATGLTFAVSLREILRQDPDIIMIGEIRDVETAKIAVTASNTGHLVLSTLHTNSAVSVISRLVDMGVDTYMVSDSLIGVISQRLVKTLCPECKKEHVVNEEDTRKYKLPKSLMGKTVYEPCGCSKCNKGYKGRTIVPEILEIDDEIMESIHDGKASSFIEKQAVNKGMVKQLDYAYSLILDGKTSLNEVYKTFGGKADE